jgi:hypothetical protein
MERSADKADRNGRSALNLDHACLGLDGLFIGSF